MTDQLTKNFRLDEFLVSSTADRHGIANTPTAEHLRRIEEITAPGMQLIRDILWRAVVITSAYRNAQVNKLVGGVPKSAHTEAYAVDFRVAGLSPFVVAQTLAREMKSGKLRGKVDQLILETSRNIVHVSFDPRCRGELLTQKGGAGTPFLKGIAA